MMFVISMTKTFLPASTGSSPKSRQERQGNKTMFTNLTRIFNTVLENSLQLTFLNIVVVAFFLMVVAGAIFSGLLLSNDNLELMGIQLDEDQAASSLTTGW